MSYHLYKGQLGIMFVEKNCVALWKLICKTEDLGKLESLAVSVITCLNDCGFLIG